MKKRGLLLGVVLAGLSTTPQMLQAEKANDANEVRAKFEALPWVNAPQNPQVTDRATIKLNGTVQYLDANGTNKFLQLTGNLPEKDSYTIAAKDSNWFAVYTFADIGYVRDDEKIDADALLKQMKDGDAAQNEARREQGFEPLTTVGWAVKPHYDKTTNNLEYGVILSAPSGENVNYHMRVLGRRGVMDAALVTSQATLQADLTAFRKANGGFAFDADESYAAFKDGDTVSEYGLAALVTGGAAAAAAKTGLLKGLLILLLKFWKLIALGAVGLLVSFKRFFGFGGRDEGDADDDRYAP
jgi:uncharacterized membrane-anchored protein